MNGFWIATAILFVAFAPAGCESKKDAIVADSIAVAIVKYLER